MTNETRGSRVWVLYTTLSLALLHISSSLSFLPDHLADAMDAFITTGVHRTIKHNKTDVLVAHEQK